MAVTGISAGGAGPVGGPITAALPEAILAVYSMDIQHTALGITKFADFAVRKTELGVLPGQTITFTRYANLTLGGELTEGTDLAEQELSASQASLTVTEYGNAVAVSEKLLQLSYDDVLAEAALLLGRDYAVVLDTELRDEVVDNVTNSVFAGTATSIATVDSTMVMDVEVVRDSVETLQTQNAPKFGGDFYIGFIHPHQSAHMKRDPDWIAANNYANTRALFTGEIGRWEDVIFIATTHMPNGAAAATAPGYKAALDGTGVGGINVYEGVIFGDSCLAMAEALPVEMRESGVQDYGRKHGIAWYSIMGFGLLYPEYGVLITTA